MEVLSYGIDPSSNLGDICVSFITQKEVSALEIKGDF